MKKAQIIVRKDKTGMVVATIVKGKTKVALDLSDCCTLADKVDAYLFGDNDKGWKMKLVQQDEKIQPMTKEEMCDLLFNNTFTNVSNFKKAMSIKLIIMIDEEKIKTYGELLGEYSKAISGKKTLIK